MRALDQLPLWADALIALLLVVSAFSAVVGTWALAKFSDFYKRLHGPTKATTMGVGGVLLASGVYFSVRGPGLSVHEILIGLFVFITAPVSAHLLVKAAMHLARDEPSADSGVPEGRGELR